MELLRLKRLANNMRKLEESWRQTTPDKNQKVHVGVCGQCLDVQTCKNIACGCPGRYPTDCAYSTLQEPIKPSTSIRVKNGK